MVCWLGMLCWLCPPGVSPPRPGVRSCLPRLPLPLPSRLLLLAPVLPFFVLLLLSPLTPLMALTALVPVRGVCGV